MGARKLSSGKPIEMREADFFALVNTYKKYPKDMLEAFYSYWSEKNKSGSKMRFELEKTWDTGRRLGTWDRNNFGNKTASKDQPGKVVHMMQPKQEAQEAPQSDIERLDDLLNRYMKGQPVIAESELASFAKALKENNLYPNTITREDVEKVKLKYNNDPVKVRSYCVERTLVYYISFGITFSGAIKKRNQ